MKYEYVIKSIEGTPMKLIELAAGMNAEGKQGFRLALLSFDHRLAVFEKQVPEVEVHLEQGRGGAATNLSPAEMDLFGSLVRENAELREQIKKMGAVPMAVDAPGFRLLPPRICIRCSQEFVPEKKPDGLFYIDYCAACTAGGGAR